MKKWFYSVISYLLLVISFYALYLSGSRGGLLAVAGGLIFYFVVSIWPKINYSATSREVSLRASLYPNGSSALTAIRRGSHLIIKDKISLKIGLALFIVALIIGAWWAFKPNFSASSGRVTTSNNVRYQIWQTSWELARNKPILGVGLGNFQPAFNDLTKDRGNFPEYITPLAFTPHNIFLMFYLTTGLLGIIAFIWLLILFYKWGIINLNDNYSKILMTMMTALIFHGLVDASYFKNDLALLFWIIYGSMIISQENPSDIKK